MAERVQYYGADGKLITESLRDYTRQLRCARQLRQLDAFLRRWNNAEQKKAIIDELAAARRALGSAGRKRWRKLGKWRISTPST